MTKRDWSSIHGEVKEAESMKTTVVVWVLGWDKTKREKKNLAAPSCFLIIYISIYIYALWKQKMLNACMTENGMCVFA